LLAIQASRSSEDLLTSKEVKELVAQAKTPADHITLAKHFSALAAKYEAEADEHVALGKLYGVRRFVRHCNQLALHARESAKAARELAAKHERTASTTPE
jgi:hypothetical protein